MTYSKEIIETVWGKGRAIAEQDSAVWRMDECGAWMRREHYARDESEYGWRIENVSAGGGDTPENLRPLHCKNVFDRAAKHAKCHVTADLKGIDTREHLASSPRNRHLSA